MAKKKNLAPLVSLDDLEQFVAALIGVPKRAAEKTKAKPQSGPKETAPTNASDDLDRKPQTQLRNQRQLRARRLLRPGRAAIHAAMRMRP